MKGLFFLAMLRRVGVVLGMVCFSAAMSCHLQAAKVSERTANFYKAQTEVYEGKEIRLDVTHLRPLTPAVEVEGVQFFAAYTYDTRGKVPGGWMLVAAPLEQVPSLLKRYGQAPEHGPRPLVPGRWSQAVGLGTGGDEGFARQAGKSRSGCVDGGFGG